MATKGSNQKNRKADPNKTKTGRIRLGPLSFVQLETMLGKSSKPKEQSKIQRRMNLLTKRGKCPSQLQLYKKLPQSKNQLM